MKRLLVLSIMVFGLLLFSGCASVSVPDYSSLNQTKKLVNLKQGYITDAEYAYVSATKTNFTLDIAGYNQTFSEAIEGDLSIHSNANDLNYKNKIKLPFFTSDILDLEYSSDKCGKIKGVPYLEVLNEDGTVDSSSEEVRNNYDVQEILQNISESKNLFASYSWEVNQIRDEVNYFDTMMRFTAGGDRITFVPLTLPIKYNGVVMYNKKEYYYFSIDEGKVRLDSQLFNDEIANFKVTGKILVNMQNFISEYQSLKLKGNMWAEGWNFDVEIKNNTELKQKI